ncbi:hypothetical protein GC105_11050 [Alkalibaculum sp. M08DMB]|uniref:Uncharacterized protein n=1 Tax=Alkalibaculum sporogenes TaxID=2655001 RepID=A0A6A7KAB8_9FIRM|nr:hypothetical protein [Alkalibaculum sporogenes]
MLLLLVFTLFAFWVMAKIVIESNHIINKRMKKAGHKGSYAQYKKNINQEDIRKKSKKRRK